MATPIGYIDGKPIFGPPRPPPEPASPFESGVEVGLGNLSITPTTSTTQPSAPPPSLGGDFFLGFSHDYVPWCTLRYREQLLRPMGPPAHLSCPASINGWNVDTERGAPLFTGIELSRIDISNGLFDKLPRELRDKIYTEAMQLRIIESMVDGARDPTKPTSTLPEQIRQAHIDLTIEPAMIIPG
jgi:hypothetical protein